MDSISRLRDNAFLVRRTQTARPFRVFWSDRFVRCARKKKKGKKMNFCEVLYLQTGFDNFGQKSEIFDNRFPAPSPSVISTALIDVDWLSAQRRFHGRQPRVRETPTEGDAGKGTLQRLEALDSSEDTRGGTHSRKSELPSLAMRREPWSQVKPNVLQRSAKITS